MEQNIQIITKKVDSPSQSVKIRSIKCYIDDLFKEIDSVNAAIREHNKLISDDMAREKCCQKVWKFIVSEISPDLQFYLKELNSKDKGVNGLYNQVQGYKAKKEEYINQISQIQSQISSIVPTINAINRVLESFGFVGFMLRENMEKLGTYKIVRPDGTDVKETLSEGERNFVSFLYFYHLCLGSNSKEGINFKKIIVIDDPISSLDSNVMFIVSTLTKDILQRCRENKDGFSQVLILTHNTHYQKEVTFWGNRDKLSENVGAYFVIKKTDNISSIKEYDSNPIKNSYELMWQELVSHDEYSKSSVFNTMRRILEHYFNTVGGLDYEKCINSFEGQERLICKSLIALINDGSHTIFDDNVLSLPPESLDASLNVFKLIFEKMGHIEHYNMMANIPKP